jgi:hypothetical protein
MFEMIWWPILAIALTIVGALGLVFTRTAGDAAPSANKSMLAKRSVPLTSPEHVTHLSDWQQSGRIDLACPEELPSDDVPATFYLRVEEFRTSRSPSGLSRMEIRWRDATLLEAKRVVARHNLDVSDGVIERLKRAPSIAPHEEADV